MHRYLLLAFVLVLAVVGVSCGASTGNVFGRIDDAVTGTSVQPAPPPVAYSDDSAGGVANQSQRKSVPAAQPAEADQAAVDENRMIVYSGSVSLQVNDTADTVNKITDLLKSVNGYISSKSLVAYGKDKLRGTISIRIPAAQLDPTLAQIKALGIKVLKEDQASNDVTAEYTDLDARRTNLEAYKVELQKLLDTVRERTGKAEDILAVYNQLTDVRGQIEQIKGRQNYLQNTSTLATYTIELVPVEEIVIEGKPGWDPGSVARQALDNLVATLQGLTNILITIVLFILPVLLILAIPIVLAIWVLRSVMKRRTTVKAVAAK